MWRHFSYHKALVSWRDVETLLISQSACFMERCGDTSHITKRLFHGEMWRHFSYHKALVSWRDVKQKLYHIMYAQYLVFLSVRSLNDRNVFSSQTNAILTNTSFCLDYVFPTNRYYILDVLEINQQSSCNHLSIIYILAIRPVS